MIGLNLGAFTNLKFTVDHIYEGVEIDTIQRKGHFPRFEVKGGRQDGRAV